MTIIDYDEDALDSDDDAYDNNDDHCNCYDADTADYDADDDYYDCDDDADDGGNEYRDYDVDYDDGDDDDDADDCDDDGDDAHGGGCCVWGHLEVVVLHVMRKCDVRLQQYTSMLVTVVRAAVSATSSMRVCDAGYCVVARIKVVDTCTPDARCQC